MEQILEDLKNPELRERFQKELAANDREDEKERLRRQREFGPQLTKASAAVKRALRV